MLSPAVVHARTRSFEAASRPGPSHTRLLVGDAHQPSADTHQYTCEGAEVEKAGAWLARMWAWAAKLKAGAFAKELHACAGEQWYHCTSVSVLLLALRTLMLRGLMVGVPSDPHLQR